MDFDLIEESEVKLFNAEQGFGFIRSKEGDVFFHTAYSGAFISNGGDEPVLIRGGEQRAFEKGTRVVMEKELGPKGYRAKYIAFADTIEAALEQIETRPELRVRYADTTVWQGKNQIELKKYWDSVTDQSTLTIEQLSDSGWVRCE